MKIRLTRERGLYKKRGLGLCIRYGDLGTEYQDNRPKLFFDIEAVAIWWTFKLSFYWRKGKNTWDQMILDLAKEKMKKQDASLAEVPTTQPQATSSENSKT
jgi:hypothetical protein